MMMTQHLVEGGERLFIVTEVILNWKIILKSLSLSFEFQFLFFESNWTVSSKSQRVLTKVLRSMTSGFRLFT